MTLRVATLAEIAEELPTTADVAAALDLAAAASAPSAEEIAAAASAPSAEEIADAIFRKREANMTEPIEAFRVVAARTFQLRGATDVVLALETTEGWRHYIFAADEFSRLTAQLAADAALLAAQPPTGEPSQ